MRAAACEAGRHAERGEHRTHHHASAHARSGVGGHDESLVVEREGGGGAAEVVHHLPVRGHFRVRSGRAVTGGLAVDDVGLDRLHRLVVEPELLVRRADVAGDEDVGVGEEARHDRLTLWCARVHGDAALVAVEHEVEDGVVGPEADHDVAQVVAELRCLDLHHVGALVTQQAAEVVDRHQHAGLHDAHTFEQVGHRTLLSAASGPQDQSDTSGWWKSASAVTCVISSTSSAGRPSNSALTIACVFGNGVSACG